MSLLTRRLLKLWNLRQVRAKILAEKPSSDSLLAINEKQGAVQKIEVTYEQDIVTMQTLNTAVNAAEAKFYSFAAYYRELLGEEVEAEEESESSNHEQGKTKTMPQGTLGQKPAQQVSTNLGDNKELRRVFQYLIRIRRLQKELDDALTPINVNEGADSDSSDELSLEEIAAPATPMSPQQTSGLNFNLPSPSSPVGASTKGAPPLPRRSQSFSQPSPPQYSTLELASANSHSFPSHTNPANEKASIIVPPRPGNVSPVYVHILCHKN